MEDRGRFGLMRATLVGVVAAVALVALPSSASAKVEWLDGTQAQEIFNEACGNPGFFEPEVGVFNSELVDRDIPSPVIGEVFDVRVYVATLGNNCVGTTPRIDIQLPPGISPAIGGKHRIYCFLGPIGTENEVKPSEGCPRQLAKGFISHPNIGTFYDLNPESSSQPLWPVPTGWGVEIRVPVKSDRIMNGFGDASGCVCIVTNVETTNGDSGPNLGFDWNQGSPATGAYQHLFVFTGEPASYKIPSKAKRKKLAKKGVPVKVTATAGAVTHRFRLMGKAKKGGFKNLGKATFKATEPETKTVKVKATGKGKKLVKKGGKKKIKTLKLAASSSGQGAKAAQVTKNLKAK